MRDFVALECTECKRRNYYTERELKRGSKLELKKYCKYCKKHVIHRERKKK